MDICNILKLKVSVGRTIDSPICSNATLYTVLRFDHQTITDLQSRILETEYGSEDYKQLKSQLPYFIPSGVCPVGTNPTDSTLTPNNLLVLDIDSKDNADKNLLSLRSDILTQKGVVGVYKSVSGKGIWVLFLIKDSSKIKYYYNYLARLFKQKYDVVVDPACGNLSRKRIFSYNPDWADFTNWGEIDEWELYDIPEVDKILEKPIIISLFKQRDFNSDYESDVERLRIAITKCANNGFSVDDRRVWYYTAGECKLVPGGFELYCQISRNNPRCGAKDTEKELRSNFDKCPTANLKDCIGKWINRAKIY